MSRARGFLEPVTVAEFLSATPDPPDDLVEGLLGPGELGVLAAEPKLGKTWFAIQLGIAVASGSGLAAHWAVPKPARTLLVVEEGRPGDLRDRLRQLLPDSAAADLGLFVLAFDGIRLDLPDHVAELIRHIKALGIGLVILDPLYRMHQQDENDAVAMRPVISALRRVADTGAAVLLVHHLRKPARDARSNGGASGADLRGTGALHAAYDTGILLSAKPESEAVLARVERRSGPGYGVDMRLGADGPGFVVVPAELTSSTAAVSHRRRGVSRGR